MKKTLVVVLALALVMSFSVTMAFAGSLDVNGAHFNLNLLGKEVCKGDDKVGSNRHSMIVLLNFSDPDPDSKKGDAVCTSASTDIDCLVNLDRRNKIFLASGTDFQVTDGLACDSNGGAFTLPSDISVNWYIYARELGKPGGTGDIVTCGIWAGPNGIEGDSDDEVVCSMTNVPLERKRGTPVWKNVTTALTTIDFQYWNGTAWVNDTVSLFDNEFYQYFWDYDNNGLRLVQLRFYPKPVL